MPTAMSPAMSPALYFFFYLPHFFFYLPQTPFAKGSWEAVGPLQPMFGPLYLLSMTGHYHWRVSMNSITPLQHSYIYTSS